MPRNFGLAPPLKGHTELIEDRARIATCWTGDLPPPAPSSMPGGISWIKPRPLPWIVAGPIIIVLAAALYGLMLLPLLVWGW